MNTSNLALGVWKLKQWLQKAKVERKIGAEKALYLIEKELNDENIEVIDITGKLYDAGLAVEVINNLNPEEKDSSKIFITEMIKPIIMKDNKVLVFGQVVIGKPQTASNPEIIPIITENPLDKDREKSTLGEKLSKGLSFGLLLGLAMMLLISLNMINNQSLIINKNGDLINQLSGQNNDLSEKLDSLISQNEDLKSNIEQLNENISNSVMIEIYTVKRGDTLISICESFEIDYYAYRNLIMSMNDISNPSKIVPGQKILIIKKAVQ